MNQIEDTLKDLDERLTEIDQLSQKAAAIQANLNDVAVKELATFADKTLSNEEKAAQLIQERTLAEVLKDNLQKANAEVHEAQDNAVNQGIQCHYALCAFRDEIRAAAKEKAISIVGELFQLARGEDIHWANRSKTLHMIDCIQIPTFIRSNRQSALRDLKSLRRVYNELSALA